MPRPSRLVVPWHRDIGADGTLTGYGGGLERKRWLLAHALEHTGGAVQTTLDDGLTAGGRTTGTSTVFGRAS
jgi:alkylated DNA nucleotide flippase Atl1